MTVYRGFVAEGLNAADNHTVTVNHEDGQGERLLTHRVRHSPTGVSWGYAGSGCADLARSILWEHLGEEPHPALYQQFKFDVVARWPQDGNWEFKSAEIDTWLDGWAAVNPGRDATMPRFDEDLAEPRPGSVTAHGRAVCHHCDEEIHRAHPESGAAWLHEKTGTAECGDERPEA
jgi:hypothetical protein